jgi:RND superfamily putative drug exporter
VFILSRVRAGYERTRSTHDGLVEGVSHTGRLVTSAALILFFALASLSSGNNLTVRELAAGMAAGVLLDAIVVRMLLLPALVSLFGRANWWMPERAARLLRLPSREPSEPPVPQRQPVGVRDA